MTKTSNTSTHTQVTLFDVGEPHLPVLPYGGSSGWSGSDSSKDRAVSNDESGVTGYNQRRLMIYLERQGQQGLTWKEAGDHFGWHHGTASGALSVLHKAGLIARLKERRNKSSVYVACSYINDRETSPHKPNVSARLLVEILTELETDLDQGHLSTALARVRATLKAIQ